MSRNYTFLKAKTGFLDLLSGSKRVIVDEKEEDLIDIEGDQLCVEDPNNLSSEDFIKKASQLIDPDYTSPLNFEELGLSETLQELDIKLNKNFKSSKIALSKYYSIDTMEALEREPIISKEEYNFMVNQPEVDHEEQILGELDPKKIKVYKNPLLRDIKNHLLSNIEQMESTKEQLKPIVEETNNELENTELVLFPSLDYAKENILDTAAEYGNDSPTYEAGDNDQIFDLNADLGTTNTPLLTGADGNRPSTSYSLQAQGYIQSIGHQPDELESLKISKKSEKSKVIKNNKMYIDIDQSKIKDFKESDDNL